MLIIGLFLFDLQMSGTCNVDWSFGMRQINELKVIMQAEQLELFKEFLQDEQNKASQF